jgi:hypothetical protein
MVLAAAGGQWTPARLELAGECLLEFDSTFISEHRA